MRAKIRSSVLGALMAVPLVLAQGGQPNAATVQLGVNGAAKGITGLSFEAETFDISFIHKPYAEAFPLGELFSRELMTAIVIALNAKNVQKVEYSNSDVTIQTIYIPVLLVSLGVYAARSKCEVPNIGTVTLPIKLCKWDVPSVHLLSTEGLRGPWAIPVLVTTPLPSALPLFGTALGLLGFMG